uniref:Uncharacterized protein n=1 Tax=Mycena chlorophos TaxID=658473 RepID=A0ABQ0LLH8_MYCCL|nr:predicted protein [Mycena chlorophos]
MRGRAQHRPTAQSGSPRVCSYNGIKMDKHPHGTHTAAFAIPHTPPSLSMSRPSPVHGTGSHGQGRQPPNECWELSPVPNATLRPIAAGLAPPPLLHQSALRATPNPRKRPRPTSPASRPLEVVGYENQLDYVVGHGPADHQPCQDTLNVQDKRMDAALKRMEAAQAEQ